MPLPPCKTAARRVGGFSSLVVNFVRSLVLSLVAIALLSTTVAAETDAATRARIMQAYKETQTRLASGNKAEALGPAKHAYDLAQRNLTQDDEELAITAYMLGRLLLETGRPLEALRPLTHAQQCHEHQQGPLSAKTLAAQRRIAMANQALERWETAERVYLDLISRYEQLEGDQTRALAALNDRLSKLTWAAGAKRRSRRYGLRALNLYKQSAGPESLEAGMVAVQLGRNAFDIDEHDEGLKLLEYGVPLIEAGLDPGDPQLTMLYEFLIEVYSAAGDAPRTRRYRVRLRKNKRKEAPATPLDEAESTR